MNIAIIGAGLMGRLLALSLLREIQSTHQSTSQSSYSSNRESITLFDKDTKLAHNSAAYAAAGLLTPLGESLHCENNIVKMGFESLTLWPKILASLDEYTFFQRTGAIMVSHEQDKGDYLRFARHLQHNYDHYDYQYLNRAELTQLEPEIARRFHQGLYLPQEGQIGNRRLLIALRKQLEKEGAAKTSNSQFTWLSECLVTEIVSTEQSSRVSYQQAGVPNQQTFDLVIDCRGTGATIKYSNQASAPLNDLRSVRGELFQLFAPDVNISRPIRLMHPRYQLYIAPKQKGFYVVGATEIESDDHSPMTVRSAMELLSAAYSVHAGFAEANIRQHVSQCRPAFSDNQPKIISVKNSLIQINGLFRHGFLIAPVVLEQALALIDNIKSGVNSNAKKPLPYNDLFMVNHLTKEVI